MDIESKDSEPVVPEYPEFGQSVKENTEEYYAEEEDESDDFYGISERSSFLENGMQLEKEEMDGSETVLGFTQPKGMDLEKEEKPMESQDINTEKLYVDKSDSEDIHTVESYPEDVYTNRDEDSDEDGTVLLMPKEDDGEDRTVLLRPAFQIRASLYRVRTGKKIKLDKSVTAIGKSDKRADIVIEENPTISRKHCTIYFDKGTYYLEDNGSSNGTWLENQKVQPEEKVVLRNESKIRLSDEKFIFYIE